MSAKSWLEWWRCFLGLSPTRYRQVVEILRQRYIEEIQHVKRFTQHAQRMQYPQFRQKLLGIASDEAQHAEWIAEKISLLGGKLPVVPEIPATEKNCWQYSWNRYKTSARNFLALSRSCNEYHRMGKSIARKSGKC